MPLTIFGCPDMKQLNGRHVLLIFIGFFITIAAVNAVMIYAAVTTFGGVDKQNAYKVGLAFGRELAEAGEQDIRGWRVTGSIDARLKETRVLISVKDISGRALTGLQLNARLGHPVSAKLDQRIIFTEIGGGSYQAIAPALQGTWDIDLQINDHGERMFRSISRSTFGGSSS